MPAHRRNLGLVALSAIVALVLGAAPARADEPSDRRLVLTGLAMAPPTYLLGVTIHEGSHAIAAKLVGGEVLSVRVFPPGIDPRSKTFRFGWTYVRGLRGKRDRFWFFIAPKLADLALLGGFAALVYTDAWPSNRYGQLALTVFGTGLWIDFSKDVLAFRKTNDVVRVFDLFCMTGWRQVPARLVYAAMNVGLAVVVARGYQRTFDRSSAEASTALVPVLSGSF